MKKIFTVAITEKDNWQSPTIFIVNAYNEKKAHQLALQKMGRTEEDLEEFYNLEPSDFDNEYSHLIEEQIIIEEEYSGDLDLNDLYVIPIKHTITKNYDVCLTEKPKSISNYLLNILNNNQLFLTDIKDNNIGAYEKYFSNDILRDEYNKFKNSFEYSYFIEENNSEEIFVAYPDEVYSFFNSENIEDYYFKVFNNNTGSFFPDSYDTDDYQKLLLSILTDYVYTNYFEIFKISFFEFGGIALQVIGDWSHIYFEKSNSEFNDVIDENTIEVILKSEVSKYPEILKFKTELNSVYSFYLSLLEDVKYENIINSFNSKKNILFKDYLIYISDEEFNSIKFDFQGNESSIKYIGKSILNLF